MALVKSMMVIQHIQKGLPFSHAPQMFRIVTTAPVPNQINPLHISTSSFPRFSSTFLPFMYLSQKLSLPIIFTKEYFP